MKKPFIYSRDPALDKSDPDKLAAGLKHFNETGERNGLPVKEGKQPAIWYVRSLTDSAWSEISSFAQFALHQKLQRGAVALSDMAAYAIDKEAMRRGLVSVEGATDDEGRPMTLEFDGNGEEKVLTKMCFSALYARYRPALVNELGARIVEVSTLDPL